MENMPVTKALSIADCAHDEYWLRDLIYEDPSILGLGDLQTVMKEKTQSTGGRLDLLLKNPSDDSMYEVEIQLGKTDESHIIRCIEYWDNEKRRWPKRSHTAVLVAEEINRRFFNVVHILSMAVPIVGIQANIVQVGETTALHFTKVIDSYEELEEEESSQPIFTEKHWEENYPAALGCAHWYRELLNKFYEDIPTKYFEDYISLTVGGIARVWINKRKNDRAFIEVKYVEEDFAEAVDYLNTEGIAFGTKANKFLTFNVSHRQLKEKQTAHEWLIQRLAPQNVIKSKSQQITPADVK